MYGVLNKLSEYIYFYISKNITSYNFLLAFKIVKSLPCIRLVPTANKTVITTILQINDSNDTRNLYILSKNMLMFTLCNRCNNCYTSFSLLKLIWTMKNLTWCRFSFHNLEKVSELTAFEITRVNFIFDKAQFRCYGFPCIFYDFSFFFSFSSFFFVKQTLVFLYSFGQ